jgi:hypothetical protein
MSFGLGNIQFVNLVKQNGAPFTTGSAHEGTSIDSTGKVVLGNDFGEPGDPGQITSTRYIVMNSRFIALLAAAGTNQVLLAENILRVMNITNNHESSLSDHKLFINDLTFQKPGLQLANAANDFTIQLRAGLFEIIDQASALLFKIDMATKAATLAGSVATSDPGSGAGNWQLGIKKAGAVALDGANYVEVKINGTIVKLGIVV